MARTPHSFFKWTPVSIGRNMLTDRYEPLQPYFLSELSRFAGCKIFVDVGANIGFYSVFMAKEIAANKVFAFEAMQSAAEEVRKNAILNDLDEIITVRQLAVTSEPGSVTFGVFSDLSGANGVVDTSIHDASTAKETVIVPASTIDIEMPVTAEIIAVKIDVEGHEFEVLKGATNLLSKNQVIIQIESYGHAESDRSPAALLHDMGYKKLISVGPDQYFASGGLKVDVNDITERALARFIEASKMQSPKTSQPIRVRVFKGITVELSQRFRRLFRWDL